MAKIKEKYWHAVFVVAVAFKTLTGTVESISGALLLVMSPVTLGHVLNKMSHGELTENPTDFIFAYTNEVLRHLSVGDRVFAGLYVMAHGFINLFIVFGLIKNKPAAYLVAVGILFSFLLYQVLRLLVHPSLLLEILSIFDVLFLVLIWHEFNYLVKKLSSGKNSAII